MLEAVEEHHVVKVLITELKSLAAEDESYKANATVLMELVRHHVEEGEREMFPRVRESIGRKFLQDLGDRMQAAT